jgi:addiction module HigA family antidote
MNKPIGYNSMRAIHPGEILRTEFLEPLKMNASALARAIHVPANRITGILGAHRAITADTAHRLSAAFGTTAQFWMNLQSAYDLRVELMTPHKEEYRKIVRLTDRGVDGRYDGATGVL